MPRRIYSSDDGSDSDSSTESSSTGSDFVEIPADVEIKLQEEYERMEKTFQDLLDAHWQTLICNKPKRKERLSERLRVLKARVIKDMRFQSEKIRKAQGRINPY